MQKYSSATIRNKIAAKKIASFGDNERARAIQKLPREMITIHLLKKLQTDLNGVNRRQAALLITRVFFKAKNKKMQIVAKQILEKIEKEQPKLFDEVFGEVAIERLNEL